MRRLREHQFVTLELERPTASIECLVLSIDGDELRHAEHLLPASQPAWRIRLELPDNGYSRVFAARAARTSRARDGYN